MNFNSKRKKCSAKSFFVVSKLLKLKKNYFITVKDQSRVRIGVMYIGRKTVLYSHFRRSIPSTQPASLSHRQLQGDRDRRLSTISKLLVASYDFA